MLDAHLLFNKEDFFCEAGNPSRARIRGIGLSAGRAQGQSGQGYGVDGCGANPARPILGKWQGTVGVSGHGNAPKDSGEISGQVEDNDRERLDLGHETAY